MKVVTNSVDANRSLAPGAVVAGRFRVEQALDSGSLAEVYRAIDLEGRRTVALKISTGSRPPEPLSRRTLRELKALQKLSHPNVVQVFDAGPTHDGRWFVAMEYVEGETLRRYLRRKRFLGSEDMLPIARQIAEALAAAHGAGVLHRDLKPENVFVLRSGAVKVADFATTRLLAEVHGERGVSIGTPAYMAPERLIEQSSAVPEDPRSDLYSLGLIEYEMLAGYNPVLGDQKDLSRAEVSWRQAAVPPRVPVGVPLEVWSVLEPALRKEPDRRPASARDHAQQLERLVERFGDQTAAMPGPWAFAPARTPTELWLRRTLRSLLAGAALGAVGGTLVFIGWWFGAHHARARLSPERATTHEALPALAAPGVPATSARGAP